MVLDSIFEHRVTARFYEIDRAGIVFFGRFFEYCHATFEQMLTAAFGNIEAAFQRGDWAMPIVHTEADFKRPIRMGDALVVRMGVAKLGDTSVTFTYDIMGPEGAHCARVQVVHAFVDPTTFRAAQVPATFLEGLRRAGLHADP